MTATNVLQALRAARQHALANAAVLDHIATPLDHCISPSSSSFPTASNSPSVTEPPSAAPHLPTSPPLSTSAPLPFVAQKPPPKTPPEKQNPTISRHILSTIFDQLDQPSSGPPNYISVDCHPDNHYLYGLVLPLIARVLAVSCPGLLAVVQLPRSDVSPQRAANSSDDSYGSNASNASRSNAATTPSLHATSRTTSPSTDGNSTDERKSNSPEQQSTTRLLNHNHMPHSLPHTKQQTHNLPTHPTNDRPSPSPEPINQDHRALRLICNGFEALTGKMPPPRNDMGAFTLAAVTWDKAGIIHPSHQSRGLSMTFSNGMVTATEGIAVSFSNGSLCLLNLWDPISDLKLLKISEETPVIVFTFATVGQLRIGELFNKDNSSSLGSLADRVKNVCDRPNFMFIEIGHGHGTPSNSVPERLESQTRSSSEQELSPKKDTLVTESKLIPKKESSLERFPGPQQISMSAIPRAIPLFVNAINQSFIEQPYQEIPENAYENAHINDRYQIAKEQTDPPPVATRHSPFSVPSRLAENEKEDVKTNDKTASKTTSTVHDVVRNENHVEENEKITIATKMQPVVTSTTSHNQSVPRPDLTSMNRQSASTLTPSSVYNFHGYPADHGFSGNSRQVHDSRHSYPNICAPYDFGGNHNHHGHAGHPPYYLPHNTSGFMGNGAYHHHKWASYPPNSYYAVPSQHGIPRQLSELPTGWHPGVHHFPHPSAHVQGTHFMPSGDVPGTYPGHRTFQPIVNGQYPSPYYVPPQMYGQNPAYPTARPRTSATQLFEYHQSHYMQSQNNMGAGIGATLAYGRPVQAKTLPSNSGHPPGYAPQPSNVTTKDLGPARSDYGGTNITANGCIAPAKKEDEMDEDKERALQVLIEMGGRGRGDNTGDTDIAHSKAHWKFKDSGGNSKDQTFVNQSHSVQKREQRSSYQHAAINIPEAEVKDEGQSIRNELHPSSNRRPNSKRQRRPSDTQSSTSTNSQGALLRKDAVTSTSNPAAHQGYSPWNPKRVRNR